MALVAVTDHAAERYLQRVRGALDPKLEVASRVSRAVDAGRVEPGERGAVLVRDLDDADLVYICIEDRPRGELIVITLWEGGEDPRVPKRFTDALRRGSRATLHASAREASAADARIRTMSVKRPTPESVALSNPDKVLFPEDGITKSDLAAYYETVAEVMVPHTRDRPMNMWRWNRGIAHDVVVQQSLPKGAPAWVGRCEVPRRKGGDITHGMINDAETLRWIAQQNCITPHVWNARCDKHERPDRLVFDLDPTGEDFDEIRTAALALADMLRDLGLTPFAKLSGSRGIHVVAPLKRTRQADEVRQAAGELAERVAAELPDTLTTEWRKDKRDGRILVDVARNTYGQTLVAAYAVRALAGAPVSAPLTWDEVADPKLTPHAYTLKTLPERLRAIGDPWAGIHEHAGTLPADLMRA